MQKPFSFFDQGGISFPLPDGGVLLFLGGPLARASHHSRRGIVGGFTLNTIEIARYDAQDNFRGGWTHQTPYDAFIALKTVLAEFQTPQEIRDAQMRESKNKR